MKPWLGHPLARYERPWGFGTYLFATYIVGCQLLCVAGLIANAIHWVIGT